MSAPDDADEPRARPAAPQQPRPRAVPVVTPGDIADATEALADAMEAAPRRWLDKLTGHFVRGLRDEVKKRAGLPRDDAGDPGGSTGTTSEVEYIPPDKVKK